MQAATGVDCHVEEPQKIYAKDWALNINLNEVETKLVFGGLAFLETESEYLILVSGVGGDIEGGKESDPEEEGPEAMDTLAPVSARNSAPVVWSLRKTSWSRRTVLKLLWDFSLPPRSSCGSS